jgi:ABC-type metal ion transport system substrate-binding protein
MALLRPRSHSENAACGGRRRVDLLAPLQQHDAIKIKCCPRTDDTVSDITENSSRITFHGVAEAPTSRRRSSDSQAIAV